MDILGQYHETESSNQYALTIVCMLISFVCMISIKSQTTKEVIKADLNNVFPTFEGSKCLLGDQRGDFTSALYF